MAGYTLADEFVDLEAERSLLAAFAQEPERYWQVRDELARDAFALERETWATVEAALLDETVPAVPGDWVAGDDSLALAKRLTDLYQRRLLAAAIERLSRENVEQTKPARDIAAALETEALAIQNAIREVDADRLVWASDLLGDVLQDAQRRRTQREETGKPVMGIPSGLPKLDAELGGLEPGLILLAGAPGTGKTSLALQVAGSAASAGYPVVYVTLENSARNLTLKAICTRGEVDTRDVRKGYADLEQLRAGAELWRPLAQRIALVEGSSRLTLAHVRNMALRVKRQHGAERVLVVIDYAQLMAKAAEDLKALSTVRERVETLVAGLRQMATALDAPVLALAAQNRAQGDYGKGKGSATLDSLAETSSLEYTADAVLFLVANDQRPTTGNARAVDLVISKNRHGALGRVELVFRPDQGRLLEVVEAGR